MSLTRSQYVSRIRDILDDDTENIWTNDFLHDKINDAKDDLCLRGKVLKKVTSVTWDNDVENYILPDECFDLNDVWYDYGTGALDVDKRHVRIMKNRDELDSIPNHNVTRPIGVIFGVDSSNNKIISVYPVVPVVPVGKTTIDIEYFALDDDLTSNGDSFTFNAVYHPLIIDYVLAWCYFKDNQNTNYSLTVQRYEKRIKEINPEAGLSPFEAVAPVNQPIGG